MGKRENAVGSAAIVIEDKKKKGKPVVVEASHKEWILETRTFDPTKPPVVLKLALGLTKNLDDYQFARMDLGVEIPCMPEEVPEYYERARKWITTKIRKEVRRINNEFPDSGVISG